MRAYSLTHLADSTLIRDLATLVARDRTTTAELLAYIAEVDARRLYAPAGYPSMHAYCVGEMHLSEDAAYKRIQAARAARQFPVLFAAVADGRLHLAGVCLLASHLTPENVDELISAATHRRKSEIEALLAEHFPRPDVPTAIRPLLANSLAPGQVHEPVTQLVPESVQDQKHELANSLAPGQVIQPPARVAPLSAERFALQLTIAKATREKLRHAQDLLGHTVPSGDVAEVLDRALDALIHVLEQRKFAATPKPRLRQRSGASTRHVPAHVRRAVWERDQGQCTFVGTGGHRCAARRGLEFDHVEPVARGGQSTVAGIRLRCRAHNQYEAECVFGAGFMQSKRDTARRAAAADRVRVAAGTGCADDAQTQDVQAGLRGLGFRADEARRAAEYTGTLPRTTLEDRMRAALAFTCRRPASRSH